jgi:hypothetical protein
LTKNTDKKLLEAYEHLSPLPLEKSTNTTETSVEKIDMQEYVKEVLIEILDDMDGTASSPAAEYHFNIQDGIEALDKEKGEFFHAMVANCCSSVNKDIRIFKQQLHFYARAFKCLLNMTTTSLVRSSSICKVLKNSFFGSVPTT